MSNPSGAMPEISDLIPHRAPMRLLERVLAADDRSLWAVADSAASVALGAGTRLPGAVALEQLAQASAAFFSLVAISAARAGGRAAPTPGMLVACRKLACKAGTLDAGASQLLQVEPLAGRPEQAGLVRFRGCCWSLPEPAALAGLLAAARQKSSANALSCEVLADTVAARALQPATTAEFSVYIPPGNIPPKEAAKP